MRLISVDASEVPFSLVIKRRPGVEQKIPIGSTRIHPRHNKVNVLSEKLLGRLQRLLILAIVRDRSAARVGHIKSHLKLVGFIVVPKLPGEKENRLN